MIDMLILIIKTVTVVVGLIVSAKVFSFWFDGNNNFDAVLQKLFMSFFCLILMFISIIICGI
jgi:hypothetical protein